MTAKQKNSLLIAAIVAGVLSLPMAWLTVQGARLSFPSGFGGTFPPGYGSMSFNVTGFNGNVTFLITAPLWFVVAVSIAANALQLSRNSQSVEIPKLAEWITALVGVIWTTLPILLTLESGHAKPALGWLLGVFCAATPLVCLWLERSTFMPLAPPSGAPHVDLPDSPQDSGPAA